MNGHACLGARQTLLQCPLSVYEKESQIDLLKQYR